MKQIDQGLDALKRRIETLNYQGFDPYDGLESVLFKSWPLKNWKLARFLGQQLVKRSPINLRPLFGVKPGENPVTLGLSLQAYSYLVRSGSLAQEEGFEKMDYLIDRLEKAMSEGFSGACWGYDFDWEARRANIPGYQPNVVATGIIVHALYEARKVYIDPRLTEWIVSAGEFVIRDLNRTENNYGDYAFSYSPFDKQRVYNASLKGSRILAHAYQISKNKDLLEPMRRSVDYVVKAQNKNGSWAYSEAREGSWVDNYHTGYVLDCLSACAAQVHNEAWNSALSTGLQYYLDYFIQGGGRPPFYDKDPYPLDCTAGAQQILSMCHFDYLSEAVKTGNYLIENMQLTTGGFAFRKFKNYSQNSEFMRWSNAWVFTALSYIKLKVNEK